ncbi:MAG TPA: hypothetical protein VD905_12955 [Flavobacteriales bacterium]|nr:hypothetical protein [Flavobacteriales bacterium]
MVAKLKRVYVEILLVLAGYLLYSACFKTTSVVIRSDGKGYYDYLPAVFIHKDLSFGFRAEQNTNHNVEYNGHVINKYPCGLAVLWTPFFGVAHLYYKMKSDAGMQGGYGRGYQLMISVAAMFYLLLGLIYLRKLLEHFTKKIKLIRTIQIILLFATNLFLFAYYDPAFSHVYSFSLITVFFYTWIQLARSGQKKYMYLLGILFALIILIRPFNALVVLFLPFLSGGIKPFINDIKIFFIVHGKHVWFSVVIFFIIVSVQPIIWHLQCGQLLPWTYSNETFHFMQPVLFKTLFGFKKGLFIYVPVLLLTGFIFIKLVNDKKPALLMTLAGALLIVHYTIASWQTWWYGGSFGLRPYIDFYSIFAVMGIVAFDSVRSSLKVMALAFTGCCLFLNVFQSWQYTRGIISEETMTYKGYKTVFLKTGEKYRGYLQYRAFAEEKEKLWVKETIPLLQTDTLLSPGKWRSFFTGTQEYKPGGAYCFVMEMEVSEKLFPKMYFQYERNDIALVYQEAVFFHLTGGATGRQAVKYYFEMPAKKFENGRFRVGFLELNEPVKIHSVVLQKLD